MDTYEFPCGKVNGFDFVRSCAFVDFDRTTPSVRERLARQYGHVTRCGSCHEGVGSALEEFATGNSKFDPSTFRKNLTYLEQRQR